MPENIPSSQKMIKTGSDTTLNWVKFWWNISWKLHPSSANCKRLQYFTDVVGLFTGTFEKLLTSYCDPITVTSSHKSTVHYWCLYSFSSEAAINQISINHCKPKTNIYKNMSLHTNQSTLIQITAQGGLCLNKVFIARHHNNCTRTISFIANTARNINKQRTCFDPHLYLLTIWAYFLKSNFSDFLRVFSDTVKILKRSHINFCNYPNLNRIFYAESQMFKEKHTKYING